MTRNLANHTNDLTKQSLHLLEFSLVTEQVAAYTSLPQAREKLLALVPSSNRDDIVSRQQETLEAKLFIENNDSLDFSGIRDVRSPVQRAALKGILKGQELWEIHDTIRAFRHVGSTLGNRTDLPLLSTLAGSITDLKTFEQELETSVDPDGEVLDSASPYLKGLRAQSEHAHLRLVEALEKTIRHLRRSDILQESLVTERNGRLVLLVKMEMRHRLPGIVHDVSDSGATAFLEPLQNVSLGNEWRETFLATHREKERVLQNLSEMVSLHSYDILRSLDILTILDIALAKGRYSLAIDATPPIFVEADEAYVHLLQARHPLLRTSAVPVDISIGGVNSAMLITGPNAGGKTVALKTLGLLTLMAQSGLQVPANICTLTIFDALYVDIGDQQSIERSLSSFSSHLQTLGSIMANATPRSLVLLDELGTSTDPEEGAALAKAVLGYFADKKISCVATTHHREVATYVQEHPAMINASVGLDPASLAPIYTLTTGLPGQSYALTIASRMGISPQIVEKARSLLSKGHRYAEQLLKQLEAERHLMIQQRQATQDALSRAENVRRDLEEQLGTLEEQKVAIIEEARQQIQVQADKLWKRLRRSERALTRTEHKPRLKDEQKDVARIRNELRSARWQPPTTTGDWIRNLKVGEYVYVRGVPQPVEVLSPYNETGTIEVLLGSITARLPSYQLEKKAQTQPAHLPPGVSLSQASNRPISPDLDLRGLRVEEAERRLEEFLDQAVLRGLSSVKVIHGGATGSLRSMVRERLKNHPLVKTSRPQDSTRTDGATQVELN